METGIITLYDKAGGYGFIKYGNLLIKFYARSFTGELDTYDTVNFEINYEGLEITAIKVKHAGQ